MLLIGYAVARAFSGLIRAAKPPTDQIAEVDTIDQADHAVVGLELPTMHAEVRRPRTGVGGAVFWSGWEGSWVFPQTSQQGPLCRLSTWVLVGFLGRLGGDVPRVSHHLCRVRCEPRGWAGSPRPWCWWCCRCWCSPVSWVARPSR